MAGLLPLAFQEGRIPNLAPSDLFRPTNRAPVLRPVDAATPSSGVELAELRWWLVPFFHKGAVKDWKAMCANARAESIKSFTLAACAPEPDMAAIHNRQPVIPDAAGAAAWLALDGPGKALRKPAPPGELAAAPEPAEAA